MSIHYPREHVHQNMSSRPVTFAHIAVDLLFEFQRPAGLLEFVDARECPERLPGYRVDLATPDSVGSALRERVLEKARDVSPEC
jgi:predicted nucleotidyltransferase